MADLPVKPPVVAVFNHKGGVAKTTTACNLGVCMAACGLDVLLVDLDAQGNATASFGHLPLPQAGVLDVMADRLGLAEAALPTPFPGLTLLPATPGLRMAELELGNDEDSALRLYHALGDMAGIDVVVVDCPPSFGMVTLNALLAASAVLIPTRPDPFAHEGLANTWYEVRRLGREAGSHLKVAGILLTMTEPAGTPADGARAIRAEFGDQVLGAEVPFDPKVADAAHLALPVTILDPDGAAGRAYVAATAELLCRLEGGDQAAAPPPGWADSTLNTLREWRAGQIAARRIPKGERGWVETRRAIGPEPPPRRSPLAVGLARAVDGRVARPWLAAAFAAGAAVGAALMLAAARLGWI